MSRNSRSAFLPTASPAHGNFAPRKRSAWVMTDIGDNNYPVNGYNTPAARGTPSAL